MVFFARPLSRKDIQVLVGYGCPSTDGKLIFSAKVLRKYVHLNEGDVCNTLARICLILRVTSFSASIVDFS